MKSRFTVLILASFLLFGFGAVSLASAPHVFAATTVATDSNGCPTDLSQYNTNGTEFASVCSASGLTTKIIDILLGLLAGIAIIFIIIGGYQMVVSSGNEEQFKKGRRTLTYAIVGVVVALFAYTIVLVIGNTIGKSTGSSGTSSGNSSANPAAGNVAPPPAVTPSQGGN